MILLILSLISVNSRHELKKAINFFLIKFSITSSLAVLLDLMFNENHCINVCDINQIITRTGTDLGRTVEEMLFKISLETWFIIFLILY